MKHKHYFDTLIYKVNSQEKYFVISGWFFVQGNSNPAFKVKINGKEIKFDKKNIARKDVQEKYKKYKVRIETGFRIVVPIELNVSPQSLEIEVFEGDNKITLLNYNERKINKIKNTNTFTSEMDYISVDSSSENSKFILSGWAFTSNKSELKFQITNSQNKDIDFIKRDMNREDLCRAGLVEKKDKHCGFIINFSGNREERYTFSISDGTRKIKKSFTVSEIEKLEKRLEKIGYVKNIVYNLNIENLEKGIKYARKHGPKKLIDRIKKGKNVNGLPYEEWYEINKISKSELEKQKNRKFQKEPKISIIVPTYNTPIGFFKEMVDSVINQTYTNWELCLGDGSEGNKALEAVFIEYAKKNPRIKYSILEKNLGIAGNTNGALAIATGDYIGLLDHDDVLAPNALYEIIKALQKDEYDILYTDEDKVSGDLSEHMDPNFKPDFSIDLFRSHNYITHFFVVKKEIMDKIGGFRSEYDGSQDYDLMFRCIENSKKIKHIPKILYHWRMHGGSVAENPESKMYAYEAGKRAIEGHYERLGIEAKVEHTGMWGMYHTIYAIPGNPLVSIIIPNKDHIEDLEKCIKSVLEKNTYKNIEIIIVENNSVKKSTFAYYKDIEKKHSNIKVVYWKDEFNYSAINNYGVSFARGNYLFFLNNDTEIINQTAISELLGCCMRNDVGVVGAKLLYEDDTVQHAGIVIGFGGFAGHVFTGIHKDDYGFMVRPRINCNYSAVTAACIMVDRKSFEEVNGFSEEFKVGLNDVDFCLKVRETGKLIVYNAFSLWHHYESKSRGYEDTKEKIERFEREIKLFQERWENILKEGDPYYNKNFPIEYGPFRLG